MKRLILVIVFLLISLTLSGCSLQKQNGSVNSPSPSVTVSNSITIENFSFKPDALTVKVGTTVTWINNDSAAHTIKSDGFNSPDLNKGDKFEFTFNQKGTFDYSCGIHPSMQGKIIVE